jgi:hypothetical protein
MIYLWAEYDVDWRYNSEGGESLVFERYIGGLCVMWIDSRIASEERVSNWMIYWLAECVVDWLNKSEGVEILVFEMNIGGLSVLRINSKIASEERILLLND